jgi:hypothetical protein
MILLWQNIPPRLHGANVSHVKQIFFLQMSPTHARSKPESSNKMSLDVHTSARGNMDNMPATRCHWHKTIFYARMEQTLYLHRTMYYLLTFPHIGSRHYQHSFRVCCDSIPPTHMEQTIRVVPVGTMLYSFFHGTQGANP